jgi:hypothetical protein
MWYGAASLALTYQIISKNTTLIFQ